MSSSPTERSHFGMSEAGLRQSGAPTRAAGCRAQSSTPCGGVNPKLNPAHPRRAGIGFVPFSPLGKGFSPARSTARRPSATPTAQHAATVQRGGPRRQSGPHRPALRDRRAAGRAMAQVALAWLLANTRGSYPSPARQRSAQENFGAIELELTAMTLRRSLRPPTKSMSKTALPRAHGRWINR